jgi:hypothetical protein
MSIAISLGYNCRSASIAIENGWRTRKIDGYKTCPFDMCIAPLESIIQCIEDEFKDFTNPEYLCLQNVPSDILHSATDEELIYNTKYNIVFLHESPGHADLYSKESWPTGKYHFVDNDWKYFRERYSKRIENFRGYISSGNSVHFVIGSNDSLEELESLLYKKFPKLDFSLKRIDTDAQHYSICRSYACYRS